MSRPRFSLLMLLRRGLMHRRTRSLAALFSLIVSAAVATALLTLYASLNQKLHQQFRAFGANILLTAPDGAALPPETLSTARAISGPGSRIIPFAYAVAQTADGAPIVVAGTDFSAVRAVDRWWQVSHWPDAANLSADSTATAALIGTRAKNFLPEGNFARAYRSAQRSRWNRQRDLLHPANGSPATNDPRRERRRNPFQQRRWAIHPPFARRRRQRE